MTVHLIADSATDLPRSYFEEKGIGFIPLRVSLGDKEFEDAVTIHADQYLKRCKMEKRLRRPKPHRKRLKMCFCNMPKQVIPLFTLPFPQVSPARIRQLS